MQPSNEHSLLNSRLPGVISKISFSRVAERTRAITPALSGPHGYCFHCADNMANYHSFEIMEYRLRSTKSQRARSAAATALDHTAGKRHTNKQCDDQQRVRQKKVHRCKGQKQKYCYRYTESIFHRVLPSRQANYLPVN
jgi:hypothetical protein